MRGSKKPGFLLLAGVLAAGSLCVTPLMEASAAVKKVQAAATVTPVPVQVSKGIQQVVKLIPELAKSHVLYVGDVDGPGVSGVAVAFAKSATDPDTNSNRAIFDPVTGSLLVLELASQKAEKPALTDQLASARALAFVTSLENVGNTYQAYEISTKEGLTTVRLVRKINHVPLDNAYDSFVTFDSSGRLIGFRNFNGKSHEKLIPATFPSAQRVISAEQAAQLYINSKPLELVYLLPEGGKSGQRQEARLVYLVKDGVTTQSHTGGAFDAVNGKRLVESATDQAPKAPAQTVTINGTGEKWSALTERQATDVVKSLFKNEPGKLPLVSFDQTLEDGHVLRYFVWGHFRADAANEDKIYELGMYPDGVSSLEKKHIMLVTDAKTGELLRYTSKDGQSQFKPGDRKQLWNAAEATLKRLLPSGPTPLQISDEGTEADIVQITADRIINGIPVYRAGQRAGEGMYSLLYREGALEEVLLNRYADLVFPQASKAVTPQAATQHLLKALPLELTYVHLTSRETGAVTWKLAYDLSFRQSQAHCFCGPDVKVDATIQVDAVSGKVTVQE